MTHEWALVTVLTHGFSTHLVTPSPTKLVPELSSQSLDTNNFRPALGLLPSASGLSYSYWKTLLSLHLMRASGQNSILFILGSFVILEHVFIAGNLQSSSLRCSYSLVHHPQYTRQRILSVARVWGTLLSCGFVIGSLFLNSLSGLEDDLELLSLWLPPLKWYYRPVPSRPVYELFHTC